nr:MAG TPA: hypothetical protein [Bacteriophage sp.]
MIRRMLDETGSLPAHLLALMLSLPFLVENLELFLV